MNNCYYGILTTIPYKYGDNNTKSIVKNTTGKGKRARKIIGDSGVHVSNAGTKTCYANFISYGTGIEYNHILYAGNEDVVSLNLSANGSGVITYTVNNGTLTGSSNPYTLTMPTTNTDVTITANGENLCGVKNLPYYYDFED